MYEVLIAWNETTREDIDLFRINFMSLHLQFSKVVLKYCSQVDVIYTGIRQSESLLINQ